MLTTWGPAEATFQRRKESFRCLVRRIVSWCIFRIFRGMCEPCEPLPSRAGILSPAEGGPASAWTVPQTGSFSFARQVPRSPGSCGPPSSVNPSLYTNGEASEFRTHWELHGVVSAGVTCPPRDMGRCPQTCLVVLGWQGMSTPGMQWVEVRDPAECARAHRTAPTTEGDPAPAARSASRQHPSSRATSEHRTACGAS